MGHRFSLTQKQVQDLIAMTPPGYVPSVTVTFARSKDQHQDAATKDANPADLIEP
ncbi:MULTISPECIES: hypothetical protein [unclassified Salipiger]|uniref:hypothetical protein n=1 Tax=unclassified Salipiger TaxID=2640570 RepID=UPI0013B8F40F|nr:MULTISPECIES: hypothetical protein [unclassified Salipiger]MCA0948156.1 hypothetical protein [Alloyangia pacifica]NDV52143.1 hypothetical protein [Salipiger sp. PrR003]NDW31543.1 hypothetical protein [Salipiger sp. PrR007]